jgi:hypothetical protein
VNHFQRRVQERYGFVPSRAVCRTYRNWIRAGDMHRVRPVAFGSGGAEIFRVRASAFVTLTVVYRRDQDRLVTVLAPPGHPEYRRPARLRKLLDEAPETA